MKTGQDARKLAVRLFRKRGRQISRAQPRFYMSDFDLLVKAASDAVNVVVVSPWTRT